eukprot:365346-Chlamydomonas_euryale.AAC.1
MSSSVVIRGPRPHSSATSCASSCIASKYDKVIPTHREPHSASSAPPRTSLAVGTAGSEPSRSTCECRCWPSSPNCRPPDWYDAPLPSGT